MRPSNLLTELSIKNSKARNKQYKITDGEGMYLRIFPNGSKYWQLQYWSEGKQKVLSLGVWPEVSLKQAREKRYDSKKKLKEIPFILLENQFGNHFKNNNFKDISKLLSEQNFMICKKFLFPTLHYQDVLFKKI